MPNHASKAPIYQNYYKVYINHTDAGGIVYHANHLTFFENCRRDWLTSLGFDGYFFDMTPVLHDDNSPASARHGQGGAVHFVVSHADLSYVTPLLVDDLLTVRIDKITQKSASLILHQSIYRAHADRPAATGIITLACVKNDGKLVRPHRLPSAFTKKINDQIRAQAQ